MYYLSILKNTNFIKYKIYVLHYVVLAQRVRKKYQKIEIVKN